MKNQSISFSAVFFGRAMTTAAAASQADGCRVLLAPALQAVLIGQCFRTNFRFLGWAVANVSRIGVTSMYFWRQNGHCRSVNSTTRTLAPSLSNGRLIVGWASHHVSNAARCSGVSVAGAGPWTAKTNRRKAKLLDNIDMIPNRNTACRIAESMPRKILLIAALICVAV